MTFQIGDKIAHPLHGAGVIDSIEQRRINGREREYFVMRLPVGEMRVMIPCDGCEEIGVRPIMSVEQLESLFSAIADIEISMTNNWNKRFRENMDRIKSGDLMEVAAVIKGLFHRESERGLSSGERKMLLSAKQILLSELVLAAECSFEEAETRLDACVRGGVKGK